MNRLKTFFGGLRWKLTLSYTIVTVAAWLVVVLVLAVPLFVYVLQPTDILNPEYWIASLSDGKLTDWAREFLSQSPPDTLGIKLLINNVDDTMSSLDLFSIGDTQFVVRTTAELEGGIVDSRGLLLGATTGELADTTSSTYPFRARAYPELDALLEAALAGERDPALISTTRESDGALIVAVPVFDDEENPRRVLGAIIIVLKSLPTQRDVPTYVVRVVGLSLLVFTLAAGVMGTIFGFLTARGLARRFGRLSTAADAWSQGNLTQFVDDPSSDELGRLAQRMNRMAAQLQELLKERQEVAILEERNRLARDLHDSVKQQAFAASAQLGAAGALLDRDLPEARVHLVEAERLVDEVRQELTDLIHQLRPVALEEGGLPAALQDYALAWANQSNIEVSVRVQGEGSAPLEVERILFRIAQEALANVAKHSQARRAEVLLAYDADAMTLTVSDDGQGFDLGEPRSGLGLRSMRERAEALGGTLTIESALGAGTRVQIRTGPPGDSEEPGPQRST